MKKLSGAIVFTGFVLATFALGGCSTTVTEKAHDKLCTGTKRPYKVKGEWYTPQEHYEYEETGVASWYGPRFHGRPKSCGEIFNMHGISAAHKTLPIPSVVRVTNVKNGTSVKLLVDDRGPFVGDRIIDLSKGAASYLGICSQGLGKVRVECLPEESKAFAQFVAQYGRYGRDPKGSSWETIFRQKFDNEDRVSTPGMFQTTRHYRPQKQKKWLPPSPVRRSQPFQKPRLKPMPVADRSFKMPEDEVNEQEIDSYLKKQGLI